MGGLASEDARTPLGLHEEKTGVIAIDDVKFGSIEEPPIDTNP